MIFFHAATNSNFLILMPILLYFFLHTVHVIIGVTFFVVFAGFASFGNFCPPYPRLRSACLRSPLAEPLLFPALYMETFCSVCVLHLAQYLRMTLGMFILKKNRFNGNLSIESIIGSKYKKICDFEPSEFDFFV